MDTKSVTLLGISGAAYVGSIAYPEKARLFKAVSVIAGAFGAYALLSDFVASPAEGGEGGITGWLQSILIGKPKVIPAQGPSLPETNTPDDGSLYGSFSNTGTIDIDTADTHWEVQTLINYSGPQTNFTPKFVIQENTLYQSADGNYTGPAFSLPGDGVPVSKTFAIPIQSTGIAQLGNINVSLTMYLGGQLFAAGFFRLV